MSLANELKTIEGARGGRPETQGRVSSRGDAAAFGLKVRCSRDGAERHFTALRRWGLERGGNRGAPGSRFPDSLQGRSLFLDKSVSRDVFIDEGRSGAVTRVNDAPAEDLGIAVFPTTNGGAVLKSLERVDNEFDLVI